MKTIKANSRRHGGFTLMELLVVISIMVILAGLTMGVMTYVNQKQAISQANIQLNLLENALEDYYSENGEYPSNPNSRGERGTNKVLQALFPINVNDKVYLTELDPKNDTQGWLSGDNLRTATILDPWGKEYYYRTNRVTATRTFINAANPGYDLWSAGPDGETTAGSGGSYDRDDPKNKDDIRTW
ncbi:MAG: type II secretion system protein GspG [Verrucomicrobiota bacterium]